MTLRTAIDSTAARSLFSSNGFRIGGCNLRMKVSLVRFVGKPTPRQEMELAECYRCSAGLGGTDFVRMVEQGRNLCHCPEVSLFSPEIMRRFPERVAIFVPINLRKS